MIGRIPVRVSLRALGMAAVALGVLTPVTTASGAATAAEPVSAAVDPSFTSLAPARLLDTRSAQPTVDGQFAGIGAVQSGAVLDLTVLGRGGVPAGGVGAVALNVTATGPGQPGFLTVFPAGETRPTASSLNFVPGQTVPNMVVAKLGAGGQVSLFNSIGTTQVVVDVMGWFAAGGDYNALSPARLADTRSGQTTVDGEVAGIGPVGHGGTLDLLVAGRGGVPGSGAGSVVVNVTVAEPTASSFLTVYPTGQPRPQASNLNFTPGRTVPNLVVATLGSGGQVSLFNHAGTTQVVVDVLGWFPTGGAFTGLTPARLADSRPGARSWDDTFVGTGPVRGGGRLAVPVLGRGGVPTSGVGAVVLNVTVTEPSTAGFVTVYPGWTVRPLASNLNFTAGLTVPNLVIAKVGPGGWISLYNYIGNAHVVVDVLGWFPGTTAPEPTRADVAANADHSCQAMAAGPVECWGANGRGQLGRGTTQNSPWPEVVAGIDDSVGAVSVGDGFSCAVLATGQVKCWGANDRGQLGNGTATDSPTPVTVSGISTAEYGLSSGSGYTCAVLTGGTVQCWGDNSRGQLGNGTTATQLTPVTVTGLSEARYLATGALHACATTSDGAIKCWGDNTYGEIGTNSTSSSPVTTPFTVPGFTNANVTAGYGYTCLGQGSGGPWCWGLNDQGQLGVSGSPKVAPVVPQGMPPTPNIWASGRSTCALVPGGAGDIRCWGNGSSTPAALPGFAGLGLYRFSLGAGTVCGVSQFTIVFCHGANDKGQLGNGTFNSTSTASPAMPTLVRVGP